MTRLAIAVALVALAACRGEKRDAAAAPPQRYTFRAEVVRLPDPKVETPQIMLRHERIPDFRNESGAVVGMDAMTMPFDLAPGVPAAVAVGDKVEAVLAVDWSRPSFRIERLTKLPADTALRFDPGSGR